MATVEVPEGVNFYSAPGQQWNMWNTHGLTGLTTPTGTLMTEDGVLYNHITMGEGASFEFLNVPTPSDKNMSTPENVITGGSGKYLVFRIRCVSREGENLALIMYDGTKQGFSQDAHRIWNGAGEVATGEWVTYVVDLSLFGDSVWYADNNPDVTTASFGLNVAGALEGSGSRYIDVQYFAVCDDWDEVEAVAGEGTVVQYTKWSDANHNKLLYSDGSEVETEETTEVAE